MKKLRVGRLTTGAVAMALAVASIFSAGPATASTIDDVPQPTIEVVTSDGVVSPASVSGCSSSSVSGGTKYTDCKVYTWVGWWSMSFYVDFTILNSGLDRIDAIRSPHYSVDALYQATSTYSFTIGQKYETSGSSAWARYTQQFKSSAGTYTKWVGIWVGANSWGQNHAG